MTDLTFQALRDANVKRLPLFKNPQGVSLHAGKDWNLDDWIVAVGGEVGEMCNLIKKLRRQDRPTSDLHPLIADEIADSVIYLDLLMFHLETTPLLGDCRVDQNPDSFSKILCYCLECSPAELSVMCLKSLGSIAEVAVSPQDFRIRRVTYFARRLMVELACLCRVMGIDLSEAIIDKFNRTSDKIGVDVHL